MTFREFGRGREEHARFLFCLVALGKLDINPGKIQPRLDDRRILLKAGAKFDDGLLQAAKLRERQAKQQMKFGNAWREGNGIPADRLGLIRADANQKGNKAIEGGKEIALHEDRITPVLHRSFGIAQLHFGNAQQVVGIDVVRTQASGGRERSARFLASIKVEKTQAKAKPCRGELAIFHKNFGIERVRLLHIIRSAQGVGIVLALIKALWGIGGNQIGKRRCTAKLGGPLFKIDSQPVKERAHGASVQGIG